MGTTATFYIGVVSTKEYFFDVLWISNHEMSSTAFNSTFEMEQQK